MSTNPKKLNNRRADAFLLTGEVQGELGIKRARSLHPSEYNFANHDYEIWRSVKRTRVYATGGSRPRITVLKGIVFAV